MKTRTQRPLTEEEHSFLQDSEQPLDLEAMTGDELEALLFDQEEEAPRGVWNLPTIAGLSLIVVGMAYFFQQMGIWSGFDLSVLVGMLPWLAGILIILLGFGVLSWRPQKKKRRVKVKKAREMPSGKQKVVVEQEKQEKKRLTRSRDKKIAGVAGGVAEYFNMDPTLVRIAFVIATIVTQGSFLLGYLVLAFIMPKPEPLSLEERITIIRDS